MYNVVELKQIKEILQEEEPARKSELMQVYRGAGTANATRDNILHLAIKCNMPTSHFEKLLEQLTRLKQWPFLKYVAHTQLAVWQPSID